MRLWKLAFISFSLSVATAQAERYSLEPSDSEASLAQEAQAAESEIPVDSVSSEYAADVDCCGCGECGSCGDCCSPLFSYTSCCPPGCWDGCGCPNDRLLGVIAKSDYCFNDFISPISNPLFFEDPRQLSEVRFIYAHHNIPDGTPVLLGGDVNFYAMQPGRGSRTGCRSSPRKTATSSSTRRAQAILKAGPTWRRA